MLTIPPPYPPSAVGLSSLVRTDNGVSLTVQTSGLEPGHAVTLWLIVANDPADCENDCAEMQLTAHSPTD